MKLNDILMAIDQETLIRVAITMYGMKFTTDHYAEYFLDQHEADELLDRRVIDMRVVEDKILEVVLEDGSRNGQ
nr:hypothetical protein [uncultured Blautia sp.]